MNKVALLTLLALPLLFVLINYSAAQIPTPRPDFIINCPVSTVVAHPGTTVKFNMSISPVNGFRGSIQLSCAPTPRVACQLSTQTISVGADLSVPFSVTTHSDTDATPGDYPVVTTAIGTYAGNLQSGTVTHDQVVHLNLQGINP